MDRLPPIPSPPEHHWREFKVRFLPPMVFAFSLLATVILWKEKATPTNLAGQVETTHTRVVSPHAGSVAFLTVDRFQQVSAGEPIAKIITANPKVIDSSLALIRAEIEMMRVNGAPFSPQQKGSPEVERLKMDWMSHRIVAAAAKVRLQQFENEFNRIHKLYKEKLLPQGASSSYEVALKDRDNARVQVEESEKLVKELAANIQGLPSGNGASNHPATGAMAAAITVQEEKLRLIEAELAPVTLYSPIDGVISDVAHRDGEHVVAGEPIVTIAALRGERIVGYLRSSSLSEAKPGMAVKVKSRSNQSLSGLSRVLRVGSQLEPVLPILLPASLKKDEVGLPILVSMPPELKLLPGEIVDLILQ